MNFTRLRMRLGTGAMREGLGIATIKFASMPLGIAVAILLARSLGTDRYGRYAFALSLASSVALLTCGGFSQLLIREIAVARLQRKWSLLRGMLLASRRASLALSAVAVALGYLCIRWLGISEQGLYLAFLPLLPLTAYMRVWSGTLCGLGHIQQSVLASLLLLPACHLTLVGGLYLTHAISLENAALALVLTYCVTSIVGYGMLRRALPEQVRQTPPEYRTKAWAGAWLSFTMLAIVTEMNTQVGILSLGTISDTDQVAGYNMADRAAKLASMPLLMINVMLAPRIAQIFKRKALGDLQALLRKSARVTLLLTLPIATCLIFFGEPILEFVLGSEFASIAHGPLVYLSIAQLINVSCGSVGLLLAMTGNEKSAFTGLLAALSVNVILALSLAPSMGARGVAIASSVSMVLWNLILAWRVWKRLGIRAGIL